MLAANQRIGEYVLIEAIGVGAFGEVWRARHNAWPDQIVAIKIPSDPQYVRNLQKEGANVRDLSHPNIVRAIAFDPYATPPYLVMEYVPGVNLRRLIQQGPFPLKAAVIILCQALAALDHAHGKGVIHRDIKPENILIHQAALSRKPRWKHAVRLADFGLGRGAPKTQGSIILSQDSREAKELVGSLQYIAPEQLEGEEADARSDIFGCGIVLFEMLTGKRPAGTEVPTDLNPELPAELNEIYRRAVARRERRYENAGDFSRALRAVLEATVREPSGFVRTISNPVAWMTAAVVLLAAGTFAVMWQRHAASAHEASLALQGDYRAAPIIKPGMSGMILSPPAVNKPPIAIGSLPAATQPAADASHPAATQVAVRPRNPLATRPVTTMASAEPDIVPGNIFSTPAPDTRPVASTPPVASSTQPVASTEPAIGGDIDVENSTNAKEARDIIREVAAAYPDIVKGANNKKLDLVQYHSATEFHRYAGSPTDIAGSYAPFPVAGSNNFIMFWGIYERWPAGKYLIVYRLQSQSDLKGENVCFIDVCKHGNTIAQRRPAASEFAKDQWRVFPVILKLDKETEIEYRFWPNGHRFALDRVYIFRREEN